MSEKDPSEPPDFNHGGDGPPPSPREERMPDPCPICGQRNVLFRQCTEDEDAPWLCEHCGPIECRRCGESLERSPLTPNGIEPFCPHCDPDWEEVSSEEDLPMPGRLTGEMRRSLEKENTQPTAKPARDRKDDRSRRGHRCGLKALRLWRFPRLQKQKRNS